METLFNKVIEYGKYVRENNLNGLKAWTDIKGLFESQITCPQWNITRNIEGKKTFNIDEIYLYVYNDLGMRGEDADDDKTTTESHLAWEKKHFLLQLIRIIKNIPGNEFNFLRLAQIAYNIGQISVYIDSDSDEIYEGKPREFYLSNKLNKIESYVNISSCQIDSVKLDELIEKINRKLKELHDLPLPMEQAGGRNDYYNKYLKYKNKYLALKKKFYFD